MTPTHGELGAIFDVLLEAASYGHADSPGLPCGDLLAAANILRNWGHDDLAVRLEAKHEMERAAIARATSLPNEASNHE